MNASQDATPDRRKRMDRRAIVRHESVDRRTDGPMLDKAHQVHTALRQYAERPALPMAMAA